MLIEVFKTEDGSFHWLDVVDPSGAELEQIAQKYSLDHSSIIDCLDPKHLPKYEILDNNLFIMLRAYDDKSHGTAGTTRELTRKVSMFVGDDYIVTVHRRDQAFIAFIRNTWIKNKANLEGDIRSNLLGKIVHSVLLTYSQAITATQNKIEEFEAVIFKEQSTTASVQAKFLLKRKIYVFTRILKLTLDILPKLKWMADTNPTLYQEIKETGETEYFESENILEYINNLIYLHLSLASHQTNEIVRILTIASVFFLPLTFIVGIYGMNFKFMPELESPYGYPAVMIFMAVFCILLFAWFRRKKWL